MEIRRKPEQVVPLLKRLNQAMGLAVGPVNESNKEDPLVKEFEKIENELQVMKDLFARVKKWEETLVAQFHALRQDIYDDVFRHRDKDEINGKLQVIADEIKGIKEMISTMQLPFVDETRRESSSKQDLQSEESQARNLSEDWLQLRMKDLFPRVKYWEETIVAQFDALGQQHIHDDVFEHREKVNAISGKLQLIADEIKCIKGVISAMKLPFIDENRWESSSSSKQHSQSEEAQARELSEEWLEINMPERVLAHPAMANLRLTYDNLEKLQLKLCLLYFSIFPDNSIVKKRPLIYWWIGEGLIAKTGNKTAEEVGEDTFQELIKQGLITPHYGNQSQSQSPSPVVNSCKMHPWTRHMLITVAKESDFFDFDFRGTLSDDFSKSRRACLVSGNQISSSDNVSKESKEENLLILLTVFNVNKQYLSLDRDWLSKLKKVVVLQLGRWQDSATHHIEVDSEKSLNGLGAQKHLKYLSLRGISRINELPRSIVELISLEILDLRACHNLEKLPSDIEKLRRLTHLDVSECYLLESMPRGLEKLSSLQVLKGFVVGDSKKTCCKIGDLAQLKKLRKLSISIGSAAVIRVGEFGNLKEIVALRILTISWGVVSITSKQEASMKHFSFPPNLKKLDLRCIPQEMLPEWLKPSNLKNLEKLYIKGGKLTSLDHGETNEWTVEILRLKYLKNLEIKSSEVLGKFPQLRYLEKIECHKIKKCENEYDEDIVWNKDEDNRGR